MGETFLSYSRHDQEFANRLTQSLKDHGIQVWVDTQEIQGGDAWRAAISRAIAECDAFLVILSPQSVTSKNVVKEVSIAESRDRHIIPIMYQQVEIPAAMEYQLAELQRIDFSVGFEASLDRLLKVLQHGKGAAAASVATGSSPSAQSPQPSPSAATFPARPVASPQPFSTAPVMQGTGDGGPVMQTTGDGGPVQPGQLNPQQQLAMILYGRWNVQVAAAGVVIATLVLDIYPNGTFNGQRMNQMEGLTMIQGAWQVTPLGQLMLQGQQSNQWATGPFVAITGFNQVSPTALTGMTATGEQVVFSKVA